MNRYSPNSQPPAGLVDVLNPAEEHRDSAYFSSSSNGDASKHASVISNNPVHYTTPPASSYLNDKTPSPINTSMITQAITSPVSTSGMTVASMVSPISPTSLDASMLAKLNNRSSGADANNRLSENSLNGDLVSSRRESVESRMNLGFESMKLAGSSPYASHNQSTTSIQASLARERNPAASTAAGGPERLSARYPSYTSGSAPYPTDQNKRSRIAPAITGPADSIVAHGAVPTQGQAWAFPADIEHRVPSSGRSNEAESRHASYQDSRRSSIADSMASSQYTTESRLPPGQRRLEDGYSADYSQQRLSRASSEFPGAPAHHHHSLQHKQIGDLMDEEGGSPGSSQPYSRTPELRVSHKLAERKRRNEMKELYDELRNLMPQERANKASKWEILSRAIAEHRKQSEQINSLREACNRVQAELTATRQENSELRMENRQMRAEGGGHPAPAHLAHQAPPQHGPPTPMEGYASDQYARTMPIRTEPRAELPPLRGINVPLPPVDPMAGLQYSHESQQANAYRQNFQRA